MQFLVVDTGFKAKKRELVDRKQEHKQVRLVIVTWEFTGFHLIVCQRSLAELEQEWNWLHDIDFSRFTDLIKGSLSYDELRQWLSSISKGRDVSDHEVILPSSLQFEFEVMLAISGQVGNVYGCC